MIHQLYSRTDRWTDRRIDYMRSQNRALHHSAPCGKTRTKSMSQKSTEPFSLLCAMQLKCVEYLTKQYGRIVITHSLPSPGQHLAKLLSSVTVYNGVLICTIQHMHTTYSILSSLNFTACADNFVKFERVVFQTCKQTDIQTCYQNTLHPSK